MKTNMNFKRSIPKNKSSHLLTKTICLTLAVISALNTVQSQDIIYKYDGTEIQSKVYEITPEFIKYKNYDELTGPLRNIHVKDVFKIKYENDKQDIFNSRVHDKKSEIEEQPQRYTSSEIKKTVSKSYPQTVDRPFSRQRSQSHNKTTLISLGYGNSFGGLGANLATNISAKAGIHIGGGWFPFSAVHNGAEDIFMVSGGARFYFSDPTEKSRRYLDVQFGMLGGEYIETNIFNDGYHVSQSKKQQVLYGPSILLGTEGFWGNGNIGGRIAGGGSYNLAQVTWTDIDFLWTVDIGLVFKI